MVDVPMKNNKELRIEYILGMYRQLELERAFLLREFKRINQEMQRIEREWYELHEAKTKNTTILQKK